MSLRSFIEELSSSEEPLEASKLINLSDLSSEELKRFRELWPKLKVERRRQVVARMVELAEENFDLDFASALQACLKDEDREVRLKAIDGLWGYDDRHLIDPLIASMKGDESAEVRALAASVLGQFTLLAELNKLGHTDRVRLEEALLAVLEDEEKDVNIRRRALEAISPLSQERVTDLISRAYHSDSRPMQVSAIFAMGKNCDPRWLPILVQEMSNPDPEKRFEAARAAGEIGEEEAVPHLVSLIRDSDDQVQTTAIQSLGKIGGDDAKRELRRCQQDSSPAVREAAMAALEELSFGENPLLQSE